MEIVLPAISADTLLPPIRLRETIAPVRPPGHRPRKLALPGKAGYS